jgi:hypothetical protein
VTRTLKCWYSFEISLLRLPRVLTCPKATRSLRLGEEVEVRRSPQAAACRKRNVRELGKPLGFPAGGKVNGGHTDTEARKGKPGNGTMRESKRTLELSERAGGGVL